MRIHVLSPGFDTPNARAFLYPFLVWRRALWDDGLDVKIFSAVLPGITDCDTLLIDSKHHRHRWKNERSAVLDEFAALAAECQVIYCDTTDSSGWLQTDLLPVVHAYAKSQLLRDRSLYTRPMYANRPFTDYYHQMANIADAKPEWSTPVSDSELLKKLRVSWNSGLADYSLYGPARSAIYQHTSLAAILRFPGASGKPEDGRFRSVSCRFGISYPRQSVAYQRELIRRILAGRIDTRKLSRRAYFAELCSSKVVVSPFGFGEITLKDFEVFLTGGLLLKPSMSHMETWPDLFRADETIAAHDWALAGFEERLEALLADEPSRIAISARGQDLYLQHTSGSEAATLFVSQLRRVLV